VNIYVQKVKPYLFELCLIGLLVKTMLAGSTIADALVLISLVVSVCYTKYYLGKKKADLTDEQNKQLEDLSQKMKNVLAGQSLKRGGQ